MLEQRWQEIGAPRASLNRPSLQTIHLDFYINLHRPPSILINNLLKYTEGSHYRLH